MACRASPFRWAIARIGIRYGRKMMTLALRNVTIDDAKMLFDWRNDPVTRNNSHNVEELVFESHIAWLNATLADPMRLLLIAEENGHPVGNIRLDRELDGGLELSWTVAPAFRGNGIARRIVQLITTVLSDSCTIRAEVKVGNEASVKVAKAVGMRLSHQDGDVLHFFSKPSSRGSAIKYLKNDEAVTDPD